MSRITLGEPIRKKPPTSLVPETAADALRKFDSGKTVFTAELGGLGPGYEQCIHLLVFELVRDNLGTPLIPSDDWGEATVERVSKDLGLSGAQVGVARGFAFNALRYGWAATVAKYSRDRQIQVSNSWPRISPRVAQ